MSKVNILIFIEVPSNAERTTDVRQSGNKYFGAKLLTSII